VKVENAHLTRFAGTIIFTVVTAGVMAAGIWLIVQYLLALTPRFVAVPAILGMITSPFGLLRDIIKLNEREPAE